MFSNYTLSNSIFFKIIFEFFFQNFLLKIEISFETIFYTFYEFIYIFIRILNFILKPPLILNPKFRLVNSRVINVIYPSLKVSVKMVSVNMKSGNMNVVFFGNFP